MRSRMPSAGRNLTAPRTFSRHRQRCPVNTLELADHQLVRVVLLLADVLEQLGARFEAQVHRPAPRLGVGAWIVDRQLVTHGRVLGPRELLDRVQRISVRRRAAIDPEPFVVADRVDDQRVTFPPADRVSVVARLQVLWMAAAVRIDRPERVRAADIEDKYALDLRKLDDLGAVRCQELTLET